MRSAALYISKRMSRSASILPSASVGKDPLRRVSHAVFRSVDQGEQGTGEDRAENRWQSTTHSFPSAVCTPERLTGSRGGALSLSSRLFSTATETESKGEKRRDNLKSFARRLWSGDRDGESSDEEVDSGFSSEASETTDTARSSLRPLTIPDADIATLRKAVSRFAEDEIRPKLQAMNEDGSIDTGILEGLFKQGYLGIEIDTKYGGSAMPFFNTLIIIEELSKVDPSVASFVNTHNTLVNRALTLYGTDEQKEKYLPHLASNMLGAFCLSERESGKDAFAIQATARRSENGDAWVLNGTKQCVLTSPETGLFLVFASYDLDEGYRGITAFLVEAGTAGLEVERRSENIGSNDSSSWAVHLKDVQVPDHCVLGDVGKGYKIAFHLLNEGHIGVAAQMLGSAKRAFELAIMHMDDEPDVSEPIGELQEVRLEYAKLATEIEAAELLTYNAALVREARGPFAKHAAMAIVKASQVSQSVMQACINFAEKHGFMKEFKREKGVGRTRILSFNEERFNMHLETIANILQKEFSRPAGYEITHDTPDKATQNA